MSNPTAEEIERWCEAWEVFTGVHIHDLRSFSELAMKRLAKWLDAVEARHMFFQTSPAEDKRMFIQVLGAGDTNSLRIELEEHGLARRESRIWAPASAVHVLPALPIRLPKRRPGTARNYSEDHYYMRFGSPDWSLVTDEGKPPF